MSPTEDQLRTRYASEETGALEKLLASGGLTAVAEQVLVEELQRRGSARIGDALEEGAVQDFQAEVRAFHERGEVRAAVATILALVLLNVALYGFGFACAPAIWSTASDRACQAEGYWYADSESANTVNCRAWVVIPIPLPGKAARGR